MHVGENGQIVGHRIHLKTDGKHAKVQKDTPSSILCMSLLLNKLLLLLLLKLGVILFQEKFRHKNIT